MAIEQLVKRRRAEILAVAARHGARNVRIFGSVVRGENDPDSDIDFLVDLEPGRTLLDHAGLILNLQDLLGCRCVLASGSGSCKKLLPL